MTQLDDFKRVLGLDENYQAQDKDNSKNLALKKETGNDQRRTVSIPAKLHTKICLLGLWMNNEGLRNNPKMYEIIDVVLDDYLERHPGANERVSKA